MLSIQHWKSSTKRAVNLTVVLTLNHHLQMLEQELSYKDLNIPSSEVYEAMGYKDSTPDEMVVEETNALLHRITPSLRPRFFFFVTDDGVLDTEKETLTVGDNVFSIGKTIARQLRGSEAFAFFAATAGSEFESFQHSLQQEDDMVKVYIADSLGSIIAEKAADCMETALADFIEEKGWKHTNRYSPGYCGWHVSEQQKLFSLFPVAAPCGIQLTDSSLMIPIKSVSGVIGIGSNVRKLDYTCGLCTYENCFRKKTLRSL